MSGNTTRESSASASPGFPAPPTHQKNSTWDAFMWSSKLSLPSLEPSDSGTATASVPPGGIPTHRRGASMPPNLEDDLSGLPPIRYDDLVSSERPRLGHRSRGGVFSGDWSSSVAQLNSSPERTASTGPGPAKAGGMDEILITNDLPPGVQHRRVGSNPLTLTTSTLGGLDLYGSDGLFSSSPLVGGGGGGSAGLPSSASRPQHRRSVTFQGTTSSASAYGNNEGFRMDSLKQSLAELSTTTQTQGLGGSRSTTPPMRSTTPPTPLLTQQQQQHLSSPMTAAASAAGGAVPSPAMTAPPPGMVSTGMAAPQPMMNPLLSSQGFMQPPHHMHMDPLAGHQDLGSTYGDYLQSHGAGAAGSAAGLSLFPPGGLPPGVDPMQFQLMQQALLQQQHWILTMQQQQQTAAAVAAAAAVTAAMQQQQQQLGGKQGRTPGASATPVMVPQYYTGQPQQQQQQQPLSPQLHSHQQHHHHSHHVNHHHHLQQQSSQHPQASVSPLVRYQPRSGSSHHHQHNANNSASSSNSAAAANSDPVLAEYKATGQRPRIEDLKGHVHAFASDAHGSRFLQYQMEIARAEDKDALVFESLPHAVQLMQDTFGNYVVQNFLEHATSVSRRALAETLKGSMLMLSMQPHGCRVVQRALDLVDIDQRNELLRELLVPRGNVSQASRNTHATHVLQKTVSILRRDSVLEAAGNKKLAGSVELMRAMEKAVADDVVQLLLHPHAYRLVLNVLGDCDVVRSEHVKRAIDIVTENRDLLSVDQHGNFMLQHMLDNKESDRVLDYVRERVFELSQHKFGSHLVEKCFAVASSERCAQLVEELLRPTSDKNILATKKLLQQNDWGEDTKFASVLALMKDPYANFVVQKAFDRVQATQLKDELTTLVQENAEMLQKFTYGRHILAHVMAAKQASVTGSSNASNTMGGGGGASTPTMHHHHHHSPPTVMASNTPHSPGMRPQRGGGYGGRGGGGGRGGMMNSPNVRG